MKHFVHISLVFSILCAFALPMMASTDCSGYKDTYPDHYCDCNNPTKIYGLSELQDLNFSDSIWFKTSMTTFTSAGMTAYLFSESDVQVDIYQNCRTFSKAYSFLVPKNQTRDMDHQTILDKLEQNGVSGLNAAIYVLFYPVEDGSDCRLMCYPYNTGPNSTAADPLPMLVDMTYVSSHGYDVYELRAEDIPASCLLYTQWSEENNSPCYMFVTRGNAENGEVVAEHDFVSATSYFHFDKQLLEEVRTSGESLYLHFEHNEAAAGRIVTKEISINYEMTDVHICQGQAWEYNGQTYTSSAVIPYDTIWASDIMMAVYAYNLIVDAPELQLDTLALRNTDFPYLYRGQETIPTYGDYQFLIQTPGECDELIDLHVKHLLTTITNVVDTTLCQGKLYQSPDGKLYQNDVTLIDSLYTDNGDTLYVNQTNVYFSALDILYDTLAVKKSALPIRLHGAVVSHFGDYRFLVYDDNDCPDSLYMHICHDLTTIRKEVEKIFCEGTEYIHNGVVYTSSATLVDTVFTENGDTQTITTTHVLFVTDELQYDTLSLRQTQLPYDYRGNTILDFGEYDLTFEYGECDQRLHLTVHHLVDTVYQSVDTSLCQGKTYLLDKQSYTVDTTLTTLSWPHPDTLLCTTIHLTFTAPEVQPDTLALLTSELPYLYRNQDAIAQFGDYDITIHHDGYCDERYALHVYHRTDTTRLTIDTTLCQGRVYQYDEALFITTDTAFVDTVRINADTLQITSVHVFFTQPEPQYDTLYLKTIDLPYIHHEQCTIPEGGLGKDYEYLVHTPDACDAYFVVHTIHDIDTIYQTIDTTLCQGKIFEYQGEKYTTNTIIQTAAFVHPDTLQITYLNLVFAAPEAQPDTLALLTTELPYLYRNQATITKFGNYNLTIRTDGECDERYALHVYHRIDTINQVLDTTICYGTSFEYEGKTYFSDQAFITEVQLNEDTVILQGIYFHVDTEPMAIHDTLLLKKSQLPYTYIWPDYTDIVVRDFGDYDYEYTNYVTWCIEHAYLHVYRDVDTITNRMDTTLCQGRVYQYDEALFITTDTAFVDTVRINADTLQITSVHVFFTQPEPQYDTLYLKTIDLPYIHHEQCTIPEGGLGKDYEYLVHTPDACDAYFVVHTIHDIDTIYQTIDTTLCQGKIFEYQGEKYTTNTIIQTAAFVHPDTLQITYLNLVFAAPEAQPDTLALYTTDLPYLYRNQATITKFGDYDLTIRTSGECDERYALHVCHRTDTTRLTIDTTLCQGRIYPYGEVLFITRDTAFVDTIQINADTLQITSIHVFFTQPEPQYDTLHLKSTDLPYLYRGQYTIPAGGYGDYDILIENPNECTERYLLHVSHATSTIYTTVDTTLCQGRVFMHNGQAYTSTITLVDSAWLNIDTFRICTTNVYFTEPEIQYDTILVQSTDLPYLYRGQYTIPAGGYGDYDILIHTDGECDERYLLHVEHEISVYMSSIDTTLCQGRIFEYKGVEYTSDTTFHYQGMLTENLMESIWVSLSFTAPEMEYDTVVVDSDQLLRGYYYAPADTLVYAVGDYVFEVLQYDECTRVITLTVKTTVVTSVDNIPTSNNTKLILRDGIIYILRDEQQYTLLGEKL